MRKVGQVTYHIEVRASAKDFSRYRELVDSDWDKAAFEAVLGLMRKVINGSITEQTEPVELLTFLRELHGKKSAPGVPEEFIDRLRVLSLIFHEPNVPKMPKQFVSGTSRLAVQGEAATTYLLLQVGGRITGETEFFRDLQSLLYLNSVHYLLPQLQKEKTKAEHDLLANVLAIHALVTWWDEPSHMFYLLAALMGHLGRSRARLDFLHRALSATPVEDHSYLTKVSAYWGELLDLGEKDAAMDLLLRLARNVPEAYVSEIREMITKTAEFHAPAST
jgi:hypothetical protein